jgi:hypothetical protein
MVGMIAEVWLSFFRRRRKSRHPAIRDWRSEEDTNGVEDEGRSRA